MGEGPRACPFVAFEFDRDQRSDRPDYRHRCYAEPTPAPRAIAHQEAYCLSPNFSACPVFLDWARRAAARPEAVSAGLGAASAASAAPAAALAVEDLPQTADEAATEPESELGPGPEPEAEIETEPAETGPEQLAAFTAPDDVVTPVPTPTPEGSHEESSLGDWEAAEEPPQRAEPEPEVPPVPPFLAGRPEPTPRALSNVAPPTLSRVKREDVVPSWEIDGRYGAEPPPDQTRDRFGGIITAIAVIAILALGVAGVIFLPGMLAGGGPAATPSPSIGVTAPPPTAEGSLPPQTTQPTTAPTPSPTAAPATATPGPEASPILYRIERGDNLRRIARSFGVTVQDILDANPQITNPNHIEVGQVIEIPQPLPTAEP
jgi:LysM repeat protein